MGSRHWRIPIPWLCLVRFLTFLHLVLLLMYSHSASHAHPAPSSQRRSPVPAIVDNAQEDKAYSVLTITMRHSKIRNKDVHVRYFTSSSASHIPSPPSKTPCWTFEPEDLYLHWQGPSNVKAWIWERNGSGETGGARRPIQAGYPHPRLPEHQFHLLKSARPTWIMKSTWQKRYRLREGVV